MTSLIHLEVLERFKFNELMNKYDEFEKVWIKQEKCECVQNLSENLVLNCIHIRRALNKQFKKEKNKIWNLTLVTSLEDLNNNSMLCYYFFKNLKL